MVVAASAATGGLSHRGKDEGGEEEPSSNSCVHAAPSLAAGDESWDHYMAEPIPDTTHARAATAWLLGLAPGQATMHSRGLRCAARYASCETCSSSWRSPEHLDEAREPAAVSRLGESAGEVASDGLVQDRALDVAAMLSASSARFPFHPRTVSRSRRSPLRPPRHAAESRAAGARSQYSMPPSISFTWTPRPASRATPFWAELQPEPIRIGSRGGRRIRVLIPPRA